MTFADGVLEVYGPLDGYSSVGVFDVNGNRVALWNFNEFKEAVAPVLVDYNNITDIVVIAMNEINDFNTYTELT